MFLHDFSHLEIIQIALGSVVQLKGNVHGLYLFEKTCRWPVLSLHLQQVER